MDLIRGWFQRFFSDPQAVILALLLVIGFVVVLTMGQMLTPVFAALVLAYLLDGVVLALQERGVPRIVAVVTVFLLFIVFLAFAMLGLLPRLSYQVTQLVNQLPSIIGKGQEAIMRLPSRYPELISQAQVQDIINAIRAELAGLGQRLVSASVASVVPAGAGSAGETTLSGSSRRPRISPSARITARSTTFSSSRTFPGQV